MPVEKYLNNFSLFFIDIFSVDIYQIDFICMPTKERLAWSDIVSIAKDY